MKAVITDGKGSVKLTKITQPTPDPYQCLCAIEACAVCTGTDQKIVKGQMAFAKKYPAILGHESFGRVTQCGDKVRYLKPNDRFLRPFAAYPGTLLDGYAAWMGGFAEYGLVTDTKAMLEDDPNAKINGYCQYQQIIPAEIKIASADATMLVTLKEIGSYIRDIDIGFGSKVVVLGAGSVGMAMCFFAKLCGAYPVIAVGRRKQSLADCLKTGADFGVNAQTEDMVGKIREYAGSSGVDFILDAAGDTDLIIESGLTLARYGTIASYAANVGEPLRMDQIKGIGRRKFVQAGPDEASAHQYLLDLVRIQAVPLSNFYSITMPFEEFERGFCLLTQKNVSKVVFLMGEGKA